VLFRIDYLTVAWKTPLTGELTFLISHSFHPLPPVGGVHGITFTARYCGSPSPALFSRVLQPVNRKPEGCPSSDSCKGTSRFRDRKTSGVETNAATEF